MLLFLKDLLILVTIFVVTGFCSNETTTKKAYSPSPKINHDFGTDVADYYHHFTGTVKCRDGAPIQEKAWVYLKDFGVNRELRDRFDLQLLKINKTNNGPNFVPQSVTFNIWAFSWSTCTDKLFYSFTDVCYDGHRIQAKAFADGHGLYIL